MRTLPLLFSLAACPTPGPPTCDDGATLFGSPNANTGLGADQCGASCSCDGQDWSPRTFTAADLDDLRAWALRDAPEPLRDDPYLSPAPEAADRAETCAVVYEGNRTYRLQSFASVRDAERAGATPTHQGRCGACSSLEDLAVYAGTPDLTAPVRQCGLDHLTDPVDDLVLCLQGLGFTEPCARIWAWNTLNTRKSCAAPCFASLDAPYHTPDGALNECLQCDETASGAHFAAYAGRTRRNTGLPSSMCRPCGEVWALEHRYGGSSDGRP